ncbi:MAG: PilZ domain-containing protein [Tepidisphaerales bacterium]
MIRATQAVLHDAIAQRATAVFSFPASEGLQHCKTRFVGAGPDGFCLEAPSLEPDLVAKLISAAKPIGVGFMCPAGRAAFSSTPLRQIADHPVDSGRTNALVLSFPVRINVIQPRSAERVAVTPEAGLLVRLSRREPSASSLGLSSIKLVPVEAFNLSLGGIGVICPEAGIRDVPLGVGQLLRVSITAGGQELVFDGTVRHTKILPDGGVRVGVQFEDLLERSDADRASDPLARAIASIRRPNAEPVAAPGGKGNSAS